MSPSSIVALPRFRRLSVNTLGKGPASHSVIPKKEDRKNEIGTVSGTSGPHKKPPRLYVTGKAWELVRWAGGAAIGCRLGGSELSVRCSAPLLQGTNLPLAPCVFGALDAGWLSGWM